MRPGARSAAAVIAVAALLAGCAPGADGVDTEPHGDAPAAFAIDRDFPDPDVLETGGRYYAYATNGSGFNVQLSTSTDLDEWELAPADVLPVLPAWSLPGKTWAPDVSESSPGNFTMYFTVANKSPQLQCIGVATATDPAGPFTPAGSGPIVCPPTEGGAIDPATFVDDDGSRYLVWKNDGNCCGLDTWLQIAPLNGDGTALAGEPVKLLKQDQSWEGNLIEAPTMVKRDGGYVLFYSANDYGGENYATGFGTATSVTGPFVKADGPLLTTELTDGEYLGPGGQDVVVGPDGEDAIVFHSWDELFIQRGVNVIGLDWKSGRPSVDLP
jgi:arabinan endo-1,5-alpha-L-arabinosidase